MVVVILMGTAQSAMRPSVDRTEATMMIRGRMTPVSLRNRISKKKMTAMILMERQRTISCMVLWLKASSMKGPPDIAISRFGRRWRATTRFTAATTSLFSFSLR